MATMVSVPMTRSRSPWGSRRQLPSARWQARHRIEGVSLTSPSTCRTERDAEAANPEAAAPLYVSRKAVELRSAEVG